MSQQISSDLKKKRKILIKITFFNIFKPDDKQDSKLI